MTHIPFVVAENAQEIAQTVAAEIAALIRERNAEGRSTVLGLATGNTPILLYRELVRLHREEGLDFSRVITFNLDEYYPMQPDSSQSYHYFMHHHLFDHVNVPASQIHIPDGSLPREAIADFCAAYEQKIQQAGGLDFQLLGIGENGHIGFNEPGSARDSRTRLVRLDATTRRNAAGDFGGEDLVPREAISMGVATILEARRIVLIATGSKKATIMQKVLHSAASSDIPATFLQLHENATIYVDTAAHASLV